MKKTIIAAALLLSIGCVRQQAQAPAVKVKAAPQLMQEKADPKATPDTRDALVAKAWSYLKTQYNVQGKMGNQLADAGWGPQSGMIPYTALVLQGLHGTKAWDDSDKMIKESVEFLADNQDSTGFWNIVPLSEVGGELSGWRGVRAVYTTSIVLQLFVDLNSAGTWKGKLTQKIELARDYLKQSQVGNAKGPAKDYKKDNVGFGGWAYSKEEIGVAVGQRKKPASNMSTSAFAIDALKACGVAGDDPLWQDALIFLKRNQNAGEVQDAGFVAKNKDGKTIKMAGPDSQDYGGAIYSEETSKVAGQVENPDGTVTLYSYGTMTYNLLRTYLFAGLKKDSLPVKLAMGWIRKNWVLEKVPGYREQKQFDQGLYYYYMSMARTLKALGEDTLEDDRGFKHDWRSELVTHFGKLQKADGSWVNSNDEWQENAPVMVTAFVLDALRNTR